MKLYDFSIFAERKKERDASRAVAEVVADINSPNSIPLLKQRVGTWLVLHRAVLSRAS